MKKTLIIVGMVIFMPTIVSSLILLTMKAAVVMEYAGNKKGLMYACLLLAAAVMLAKKFIIPYFIEKERQKTPPVTTDYYEEWKTRRILEMERTRLRPIIHSFLEKKCKQVRWYWTDNASMDRITFITDSEKVVKAQLYFDEKKEKISYAKCQNHPNLMGEKSQKCVPRQYLETFYNDFVMEQNDLFSKLANEAAAKGSAIFDASKLKDKRERKILAGVLVKESGFSSATVDGKSIVLTLNV